MSKKDPLALLETAVSAYLKISSCPHPLQENTRKEHSTCRFDADAQVKMPVKMSRRLVESGHRITIYPGDSRK